MAEPNIVDLTKDTFELNLDVNKQANLFPDVYEQEFTVSKEEEEALWENIKKEYKDEGVYDKYFNLPKALQKGEAYQEALAGLEKEKLDNKTNHISNIIGEPVENVGMTNVKDMSLVFDISRSKLYKNRKKKFLKTFEGGDYQRLQVNVGGGNTETYELFKYNKDDKTWKVLNPDGRNMTEMAAIAGMFLDEQLAGDVLMLTAPKIMQRIGAAPHPIAKVIGAGGVILDKIPPTLRIAMGNWLGLKGKKLNEWLRGFGEEEFETAESLGEVDKFKFFTDLSDWSMAAISGGAYKGMTELTNWLVKGKTPGMVDLSEDIIRAAEKLKLDPLVFAQLSTNPIVRRMFVQAGLFVNRPGVIKIEQLNKLKKSLHDFGIGNGKGQLNMDELLKLNEELALKVGDRIKMFNKNFPDLKSQKMSLDQALNEWNKVSNKTKANFTQKVFSDLDHLKGASINIDSLTRLLNKKLRSFVTPTTKKVKVKVRGADGKVIQDPVLDKAGNQIIKDGEPLFKDREIIKTVKGTYGKVDEVFSDIVRTIKNMTTKPDASASNLPTNVLSQLNDPKFKNLETLFNMRDQLFKLTKNSDPKISGAAVEMHNHLKMLLDPDSKFLQGSDELISKINILNKHVDGMENVQMLGFVKDALGTAKDPDAFVRQFLHPGSTLKIAQLKNILTEGAGNATEREAGEAAFNILRKTWFNNILQEEDGIKALNQWMSKDMDGLKILLGDNWSSKVDDMKNIIGLQNKLSGGIISQSIKGTEREITDMIVKASKQTGIPGHGKYFDDIISDYGGFNSNSVEMIRFHIIKDMLDQAKMTVAEGKKMFTETLDPKILKAQIRELQKNPYLMKFFDDGVKRTKIADTAELAKKYGVNIGDEVELAPPMIEALQNYNLYTTALAGQSDMGGMLAAAELAHKTTEGIYKPNVILQLGLSLIKHDIVSRLLSKKATSAMLKNLDSEKVMSKENLQLVNLAISEIAKEIIGTSQGYNKMEDNGILYSYPEPGGTDTSLMDTGTGSSTMLLPKQTSMNIPLNINRANQQSSLANPNLGFRSVGGGVDPNRAALAFGPGDILAQQRPQYAAQGGIMSTNKAFQRVA